MDKFTLSHLLLSPVKGKPLPMNFDGADMSSNAGLTLLREVERRMGLADKLASCLEDPRDPDKVHHSLEDFSEHKCLRSSVSCNLALVRSRIRARSNSAAAPKPAA